MPIDSVGRSGGTELAPAALREHRPLASIGADDAGDLPVRIQGEERDPATGVIGSADVLRVTTAVREAVCDVAADMPLSVAFGLGRAGWVEAAGGPSSRR